MLELKYIISGLVLLLSIILTVFLSQLLKKDNRYFTLVLFTFFYFIETLLNNITFFNKSLLFFSEPISFVYGPLLYIYTRNLSKTRLHLNRSDIIYFFPFILAVLTYIPTYILTKTEKILLSNEYGIYNDILDNTWEWNCEILLNVGFLLFALIELNKYNIYIKRQLSDIHNTDLHITKNIIRLSIGIYLIEFIFVYLAYLGSYKFPILLQLMGIINFCVLLLIGFDALKSNKQITEIVRDNTIGENEKYQKSSLQTKNYDKVIQIIEEQMYKKKMYLKPQLKIKDLAKETSIPTHHISQVINDVYKKNFYEYINSFRVKEAIELIQHSNYQNFTIMAIGYESGFNSKTAFYNSFKKETNKTPAEYRNYIISNNLNN
jgi:AraC-like DNA-binding protein